MPSSPKGAFLSDDGGKLRRGEWFLSLSVCVCVCVCVCKSVRRARVDRDTPETKHQGVVLHCEEGKEAYLKYVE